MYQTTETAWNTELLQRTQLSRGQILNEVERRLGVRLNRNAQTSGNRNPSIGIPTEHRTWVRISWHEPDKIFPRELSGLETSLAITGVPRPEFIQACHWAHSGVIFRAEEMTLADERIASPRSLTARFPDVDHQWWQDLSQALKNLSQVKTNRISLPPAPIARDIKEFTGSKLDTRISEWITGHGDLHWANLTAPRLHMLDWECWGRLPRGADAATLWATAFCVPELAEEVQDRFRDDLSSRDGRICKLWISCKLPCADIESTHGSEHLDRLRRVQEDLIESLS